VAATNAAGTGPASVVSSTAVPGVTTTPVIDVVVPVNGTGTTATTPAFNTAKPNEVLLAFVAADGSNGPGQTTTVSGAGLSWSLVGRSNTQPGTSEVWMATAPNALTNATVTSTESRTGFHQSLTVVAFQSSLGAGAVRAANGTTGAPSASITTTRDNS